jgi:hypothetical protein
MPRRQTRTLALTDPALTREDVVGHLQAWREDTRETLEALTAMRAEVEEASPQLENPRAVLEYVDDFLDWLGRAAGELESILAELPVRFTERHVDTLRQLASNASADQQRCLIFRDRWINRPLPYEQVRPLLRRIATLTRDQLADYRELAVAADRLQAFTPPEPVKPRGIDRRALFSRFLQRPETRDQGKD